MFIRRIGACTALPLAALSLAAITQTAHAQTYTFEGMTAGAAPGTSLSGQDTWALDTSLNGVANTADTNVITGPVVNGRTTDVTNAAQGFIVAGGPTTAYEQRIGANIGFTVTQTSAIEQFDTVFQTGGVIEEMALAGDTGVPGTAGTPNGFIDRSEVGALFGINNNSGSPTFQIRAAGLGGGATSNQIAVPASFVAGDLLRLQLVSNFVTGTASLYYRDISTGDTTFTAVAGLQNISMGLTPSATVTAGPADYNAYFLRLDNGGIVDNLLAGAPAAAPEPSQYAGFGLGVFGLGVLALRARRRSAAQA